MLDVIVPVAVVVGIAVGAVILGLVARRITNSARQAAAGDRDAAIRIATEQVTALAGERLSAQATLGAQQVASDRELVQRGLATVGTQMDQVRAAMAALEAARAAQQATLSEQIRSVAEQATALQGTTASLRAALASPQARGQWGERMAEDVLRAAGLIEGVNYHKRKQAPGGTGIPDFAFPLPNGLRLNMDVKFPLSNYLRYLDAGSDVERQDALKAFTRDVRSRVREVTDREYIDPANGTVDCVLLLIPNEQVHAFIHANASALVDEAMAQRVILCSPIGLIGVLAVIRQAADSFAFQQAARECPRTAGGVRQAVGQVPRRPPQAGREARRRRPRVRRPARHPPPPDRPGAGAHRRSPVPADPGPPRARHCGPRGRHRPRTRRSDLDRQTLHLRPGCSRLSDPFPPVTRYPRAEAPPSGTARARAAGVAQDDGESEISMISYSS